MTRVKICGLMEPEHVQVAVEAGADAIGFVFAPSRRRVTVERAHELAKNVPDGVLKIGVFVNATAEELERTYREVPLDYIQYHGDESADFINKIGLPSIKVLSVRNATDVKRATEYNADYFLFDTPGIEFKGGSGKTFNWDLMKDADIYRGKMILAGGLSAENVKEAIKRVNPYMVDVSSGVENAGTKDGKLIREFISAIKEGKS